jgi:hypothetical protein
MAEQTKIAVPTPYGSTHPFKLEKVRRSPNSKASRDDIYVAVAYHSALFTYMEERGNEYFKYKKIDITNLDKQEIVPSTLDCSGSSQNFYCVLNVKINNLRAQSAELKWVKSDRSENDLDPIKLDSEKRQTEARVIIGVVVCDTEYTPGLDQSRSSKFPYIIQFVNTNLIMCNMVFNGVPVVYPAPISGGRLNF